MASSRVTGNAVVVVRHFWGRGRGHCLDRRGSDNRRRSGRRRDGGNDRGRIRGRRSRWTDGGATAGGAVLVAGAAAPGAASAAGGAGTSSARAMTGQSASAETKPTV